MTAPLLCLLIKRMSQPVSGKLNSNKKYHGAQPAKGDGLHQKDSLRNRLATNFGNAYQQTSRVSTTATTPSRYHWPGTQDPINSLAVDTSAGTHMHQGSPTQPSHGVIWVPRVSTAILERSRGKIRKSESLRISLENTDTTKGGYFTSRGAGAWSGLICGHIQEIVSGVKDKWDHL